MSIPKANQWLARFRTVRLRRRIRLRRWSDRIERIALIVALTMTPLAPVIGVTVGQATLASASGGSADRAGWSSQTMAKLIEDPKEYSVGESTGELITAPVQATWRAPDGTPRSGAIDAPAGARAGQIVPLWVDAYGKPIRDPDPRGELRFSATATGIVAAVGWLVLLAVGYGCARWLVNRHQLRQWGVSWAKVERRWRRELL